MHKSDNVGMSNENFVLNQSHQLFKVFNVI